MKIRPIGAEFFHMDGRTHTTKLKVAFRNFANASRNRRCNTAKEWQLWSNVKNFL